MRAWYNRDARPRTVLPNNCAAVRLFYAVQTQWQIAANGWLLGLDYAGVRAAADLLGLPDDHNAAGLGGWFARVQIMEAYAVEIINAAKK